MDTPAQSPVSPAGAPVASCDQDQKCTHLDCDAVVSEFGQALAESTEGKEFVAHYCGLEYVNKLHEDEESSE